jgi:hypothetical protein
MERLRRWTDWYTFARKKLEYEHEEADSYARVRYAEELNRQRLAGTGDAGEDAGGTRGPETPAARGPDPR